MEPSVESTEKDIDLLIATALTEEAQVVSAVMSRVAKEHHKRGHAIVYEYPLGDGTAARVATASAHQMGAVNMGVFIAPLLNDLRSRSTTLVGIAAAIDAGEVALGDVPFASQVLSYDDIAVETGTLTFRTEGYQVDPRMRHAVGALRTSLAAYAPWQEECLALIDSVIEDVSRLRRRAVKRPEPMERPHLIVGATAGGPFLLRDRGFSDSLREHPKERELAGARIGVAAPVHSKLVSAEMESHGFMRAAHEHGVPATVIKGISDVGDQEKARLEKETGGFYRAFACSNAVLAALHILRYVEPRNPAPGRGPDARSSRVARGGSTPPSLSPLAGTGQLSDLSGTGPRSHVPEPHKVFVGRDAELKRIAAALDGDGGGRVAIVAVQGMAGVGKTYLAHEFYTQYPERFGGYQHVVLAPGHPGTVTDWLRVLGERVGIDPKYADEAAVAQALRAQRVLVHVDNVDSAESAELVAALSRALGGVPLLVTGRYAELGTSAGSGWTRIELAPLDAEDALRLLHAELTGVGVTVPESELRELVRQVAGLPLALHIAAGYLRRGTTVARFLARLREQGLALGPRDPADHVLGDRARGVLSTSFAISRELLLAEAGSRLTSWEAALVALGWAPRVGFGRSLGAAITGLDEASGAFDDFMEAAVALSLVQWPGREGGIAPTWGVHPLLGEFLRAGTERGGIDARVGAWVVERADDSFADRAARWDALSMEATTIGEWLGTASDAAIGGILPCTWAFATSRGPMGPWLAAAQRVRREGADRRVLWALCQLDYRAGELESVRNAAAEIARLAGEVHDDRGLAFAQGMIADVLEDRGELEEALRIRWEEELPVYERIGDVRARAITQGKIAGVLASRGEPEEALRIWRKEVLPACDQLGDVTGRAATQGSIADVLFAHGELDEALRIRREEQLPVFEKLGDVRACAVTQGKIAYVLFARGELEEALRIQREEVLPVFERLGDVGSRAKTQGKIADVLAARGERDEALRILREEVLPVFERRGDVRARAFTQGKIADVLFARGELDESLRIRREEELPVYERLGDVRSRAITLGQIADVLAARGEVDEALRIWREEELPVYERIGDVRKHAITRGKIADVLAARDEVDVALAMWRESLAVFHRLAVPNLIKNAQQRIEKLEGQRR